MEARALGGGYFQDVRRWYDQTEELVPSDHLGLRQMLLEEELTEYWDAFNQVGCTVGHWDQTVAKETADVIFVLLGTMLECGIDFDRVWSEVVKSNMTKLAPPILRDDRGKILKSPSYVEPDLDDIYLEPDNDED